MGFGAIADRVRAFMLWIAESIQNIRLLLKGVMHQRSMQIQTLQIVLVLALIYFLFMIIAAWLRWI